MQQRTVKFRKSALQRATRTLSAQMFFWGSACASGDFVETPGTYSEIEDNEVVTTGPSPKDPWKKSGGEALKNPWPEGDDDGENMATKDPWGESESEGEEIKDPWVEDESDGGDESESEGESEGSLTPESEELYGNFIICNLTEDYMLLMLQGAFSNALMGSPLCEIEFIALGSNINGWTTQLTPPEYHTPFTDDWMPHGLLVPTAVTRFNLWAAGCGTTRWFDLREWIARGAGCHVTPDGLGGLVVER